MTHIILSFSRGFREKQLGRAMRPFPRDGWNEGWPREKPGVPLRPNAEMLFLAFSRCYNNLTNRDHADAGKGPGKLKKGFVAQAD